MQLFGALVFSKVFFIVFYQFLYLLLKLLLGYWLLLAWEHEVVLGWVVLSVFGGLIVLLKRLYILLRSTNIRSKPTSSNRLSVLRIMIKMYLVLLARTDARGIRLLYNATTSCMGDTAACWAVLG